ncbi:sulfur carrier protein ThiS [Desulfobulbus rhabdoformis]|uniref:sulfur carrier protein ThiS n=1 Tax=Desulfobulbus rhabdoformis TaxID=34032 RepID=UPI001965D658|nr:sulfur carrier protein ThiS [Desulfobulbus rhabdoformis]MBM9613959.1 sulfur carrier protein ThiS [Desulfobulbus rhabdoformis]
MKIFINGNEEHTESPTLADLIASRGLDAGPLVVELNQQIIKQEQWQATSLNEEDRLELLSFVGGG